VEFRVLGSLEVRRGAAPIDLRGQRLRTLLVSLLVDAGSVVSVDTLADALWGEQPPSDPRNAIQTYVARLRGRMGDDAPLVTRSPGYVLDVGPDEVDACRFERLLAEAQRHRARPAEARRLLDDALSLWHGPAYAEFADGVAHAEALRLEEKRLVAIEESAAARLVLGEASALVGELEAAVSAHPLRERMVALLMETLAIRDRPAEALAAYRAYRERLADEAGLEPSSSVLDLEGRILRGELVGSGRAGSTGVAGSAVVARTVAPPVATTPLIGREAEIAAVRAALARHRVVTLTGTGGVGKTRLAAEIAAAFEREAEDEVGWVELAPVADPSAVEHVVATALGVAVSGGSPVRQVLIEALASRRLVAVLDNVEHVLDTVAPLVDDVVRYCQHVRVVVTSRARLAIEGERVIVLGPLATDGEESAAGHVEAVQLFLARAELTGGAPTDQLTAVAEICRELDGLPLAIELAAARTGALAPTDLLETLRHDVTTAIGSRRGRPERHRDLWSVVDWSYRMLDRDQQLLFERLGVFAATFRTDEAHAVCADETWAPHDTTAVLTALVERSLVNRPAVAAADGAGRYRLLRPVRAFARQRLADHGEFTSIADRHASVTVERAERAAGPPLTDAGRRWLEGSLDELREVRRRAHATGETALVRRLVGALYRFDYLRPGAELLGWADDVVDLEGIEDAPQAPQVLAAAAAAAWRRGDLPRAGRLALRGTEAGTGPDDPGRMLAFEALGDVATFEGRLADAESAFREEVRLARMHRDPDAEAMGLASTALVLAYAERTDEAVDTAETAVRAARSAGPAVRAFASFARGECLATRDPSRAIALVEEAAERARTCDAWFVEGVALVTAASLRARYGQPSAALPVFADLLRHWHRSGSWIQQWTTLRNLAELLARLGADEPAVVIASASASDETAGPAFGAESERLAAAMRGARRRLGDERSAAALARGRQLTGPQVVELALGAIEELVRPPPPA
jgi:predicted ATPase/DNA-binding SARP family transcriptional activator